MKDEMKEWFKKQDFDLTDLPQGHEQRFLDKLEAACQEEPIKEAAENNEVHQETKPKGRIIKMSAILKWSAAAVIALMIGSASFMAGRSQTYELKSVSPEMAAAQSNYVEAIDQQLAALNQLKSPATERIIADAKASLQKLETDYKKIQKDFRSNSENPAVIDAMIQNFKTRILLLEDARAQIKAKEQQLKKQQNELI
ncbi:hypothetical protein AAU57_09455 [Nonlabens sp. YIK11]|uniref:hypothetical protein n=1 Tax=Nonlabens sp. YIK11 TaxID=1453349 RepID=UPI0006DC22D2|nr:hypothetical protein [Nonlabens sp. YIK11]KQC33516.1 hypothetical protein AAU57_09455 [Nonlabens sp. YIK11]